MFFLASLDLEIKSIALKTINALNGSSLEGTKLNVNLARFRYAEEQREAETVQSFAGFVLDSSWRQ